MPAMADRPVPVLWRARLGAEAARRHAETSEDPDLDVLVAPDADPADVADHDPVMIIDGRPPAALLDAPSLRHVILPWAGLSGGLIAALRERPRLTLHNSHFNAPFVAQHAFALLLACAGRLGRYDRALRRGDWGGGGTVAADPEAPRSVHLAGEEALLLGYGAIGRALVPMLAGVGMVVTALRREPDPDAGEVRQVGPDALHEALGRARAVIVSLPATDATRDLLAAEALSHLREGALLVNVGRADVIDEDALWATLQQGRLAGVGLDVWWRMPDGEATRRSTLPSRHPFHLHPNVILSPHRADLTESTEETRVRDVLQTIRDVLAGGDRNRVDVASGY